MDPRIHAGADRGHRLRLGEDLRVGADAHFQILTPRILLDQDLLQMCRLRRPGLQPRKVVAHQPVHLGADCRGGVEVAACAFLDHALDHRRDEGHPGGLDRVEIDRREQPRFAVVAFVGRRVGQHVVQPADALTGCGAQTIGRRAGLAQIAHGREACGYIQKIAAAHRDDGRAGGIRPPHAPRQRRLCAVVRQHRLQCVAECGHASPPKSRPGTLYYAQP